MPMPVSGWLSVTITSAYLPMLYLADYRVDARPFTASLKQRPLAFPGGRVHCHRL